MKPLAFFLTWLAASQLHAAVLYDGIRTGSAGIRDFYDTDDRAGIYISTGGSGYALSGADVLRAWNAAPFNTWPDGVPQITIYGTLAGSNLGGGVEASNNLDVLGVMAFNSVLELRGTVATTQEIVSLLPAAPIILEANHNYWAVVTMASGNGMSILSSPGTGTLAQNIIGSATLLGEPLSAASGGYSFRLLGTAIPEPSGACMIAAFLLLPGRKRTSSKFRS